MLPNRKIKLGTIILLVLFYFSATYGFLDTSTSNTNDQPRTCNLNRQELKSDRRLKENERRQVDRTRLSAEGHLLSRESLNRVRDLTKTDNREGLDSNNNIVRRQIIAFDRANKREREHRESERRGSLKNNRDLNEIRQKFADQRQAQHRLSPPGSTSSVSVRINKDLSRQTSEDTRKYTRNTNTRQNDRIEDNRPRISRNTDTRQNDPIEGNRRRISRNGIRQDSFSRRERESNRNINGIASTNNQRFDFSRVVNDRRQRRTSPVENTFRKNRDMNEEEMHKQYNVETNGRTTNIRRNRDTSIETRRTSSDRISRNNEERRVSSTGYQNKRLVSGRISRENNEQRRINLKSYQNGRILSDRISRGNVEERRVRSTSNQDIRTPSNRISRENSEERRISSYENKRLSSDRISRNDVEERRVRSTSYQHTRTPSNRISRENSEERRTSSYENKRTSSDRISRNNFEDRRVRSISYENTRTSAERIKPANRVEQSRNRQIRETERISSDKTSRNDLQERRIISTASENRRTSFNRLPNSRQSQTERIASDRLSRDTFEEREINLPSHQSRQISANRISRNNLKERRERLVSHENRRDQDRYNHRSENEMRYSRRSIRSIENSFQRTDFRRFNSPERKHIRQPLFRDKREILEVRLVTNERNLKSSRERTEKSRDREQRNTLRLSASSESRKIERNNVDNDRRLVINSVDNTLAMRSSLDRSRRYDFESLPERRTATNRRSVIVRQNARNINERTMEDRSRSQRMIDRSQKPVYRERLGQRIALTNRISRQANDKRLSSEVPKRDSTTLSRRFRIANENQPKVIDNNNRRNRQSVAFHEKRTAERTISGSRRNFDDRSTEKSFSLESRTIERRLPKQDEEYIRLNNYQRTTFNSKPNNEEPFSWLNMAKVLLLSISIAQIVSNSNSKKFRFNWLTNYLALNKEKVH